MKKLKIMGLFLVLVVTATAQKLDPTITESPNTKRELIVDINLTNPLLFGKAGGGVEWRSPKNSLYVYANYKFGLNAIAQTVYFNDDGSAIVQTGSGASDVSIAGFDVGFQIRFRDRVISREYAKYLNNVEEKSPFYSGIWIEASYVKTDAIIRYTNNIAQIAKAWDMKLGPLFGWGLKVSNFNVDLYGALGLGFSAINFNSFTQENQNSNVGIFKYDLGVKLGYKIR